MGKLDTSLRPAWINYWKGLSATLILLIVGFIIMKESQIGGILVIVVSIIFFLKIIIQRYSLKFFIKNNRITMHEGILTRNQQEIGVKQLRSVELHQSIFQRIFGIGDLYFYSAGSDTAEVYFLGIKDPNNLKDKINQESDNSNE